MSFRSFIDLSLAMLGVTAIVVPVVLLSPSWVPILMVMAGALLVGAGNFRLGSRLLPDRRVYVGLRSEVEDFIELVRRVNAKALAGDGEGIEELRTQMKVSVDRMVSLAGGTEES